MNTSKRILNILFVAALILALVPVGSGFAEGLLLSNGFDPNAIMKTGVQMFNFGNSGYPKNPQIGVMVGDLYAFNDGGSKTSGYIEWTSTNKFDLTYSPETGMIILWVNDSISMSNQVGDLGALNYINLLVKNKTKKTSVQLRDLTIGSAMTDWVFNKTNGEGMEEWNITGMDLSAGFIISGYIDLGGNNPQSGGDSNMVEIGVGNTGPKVSDVAVTPIPLYLNTLATVSAQVGIDYPDYADTNIASAKYSLNQIDWLPMDAADGFGGTKEDVSAFFPASPVGDYIACVHAWDNLGNLSDDACAPFSVHYVIDGLFDPIDETTVNVVKAGKTVPIKWRLTDGNGDPVSDPNSFAGIPSSYQKPCDEGESTTEVFETPGESGLQYLGDGYWQYNWKTLKSYAGSCFVFFVQFDSGQETAGVQFQFK